MEWCLACHRNPEKFVRPKEEVFNMKWRPQNTSAAEIAEGRQWVKQYNVQAPNILTSCSTCHR
jgi:cytochrome c553